MDSLFAGKRRMSAAAMCMLAVFPANSISIFAARVLVMPRYLLVSYAAVIFFVGELWSLLWPRGRAVMMALCLAAFALPNWMRFQPPPPSNLHSAVAFIQSRADGPELALSCRRPRARVAGSPSLNRPNLSIPPRTFARPTKYFGEEDWYGNVWRPYYRSPEEFAAMLERIPVKYCILSQASAVRRYPHDEALRAAMEGHPEWWRLVFSTRAACAGVSDLREHALHAGVGADGCKRNCAISQSAGCH